MVSGGLLVAAFAAVAGLALIVAVRLHRISRPGQSPGRSVSQSAGRSKSQSAGRPVSQSAGRSKSQSAGRPVEPPDA
jgi:hypothetical protein